MALYCKDCHFFMADESFPRCSHEKARHFVAESLVHGPAEYSQYTCQAMRAGICGPGADLFKSIPVLLRLTHG